MGWNRSFASQFNVLSGSCSTAQVLQYRGLPQKVAPVTAAASPDPSVCSAVQVASSVLYFYITDSFTSTELLQYPVVSYTQQPTASLGKPLGSCQVREQFTWLFSLLLALQSLRSPRSPSLLIPIASLGSSKTTFRFDNSPEVLTELTQSYYTHSYGLLNKRILIKIYQGKRCMGQIPGEFQTQIFQGLLPVKSWSVLTSFSNDVQQYAMSIANQGSSPKLWCPEILLGHTDIVDHLCGWPWAWRLNW